MQLGLIKPNSENMDKLKLSIVIPFRASADRPYLLQRLKDMCCNHHHGAEYETILVDSGSDLVYRSEISALCLENGIRYIYHESYGDIFAIGAARDFGVQNALGEHVTFLDVDLVPVPDFARKMCELADITGVTENHTKFFVVPCLYLTADGTEKFLTSDESKRHRLFLQKYHLGEKEFVQNLAQCSSVMMISRRHYLSIGGHRPEFKGHGYEDFELIHRLCAEEGTLPRPDRYYDDSKTWDNATYNGFRSYFALKGKPALFSGLFVVHLWHPRPPSSGYEAHRFQNHANAATFFQKFDKDGLHPTPLEDLNVGNVRTLFFGVPNTAPMECIRGASPYFGTIVSAIEYTFQTEDAKFDEEGFQKLLNYQKIDQLLFTNPYGNSARLAIYEWARAKNFPYFVFERGALPESWFFDPFGFNADSASYDREKWDQPLSETDRVLTQKYIGEVLYGSDSLEAQGQRIGAKALASNLRIGGRRVLFVPFQRPSDTVIKYFAGEIESVENFSRRIDESAKELAKFGWVVVCKKHPLETEVYELQHAKWVDADTHFLDLIELADSVALINSGVGLYSLMMGKPTFILGKAFYADPRLNVEVKNDDNLCKLVIEGFSVCHETRIRLIAYLHSRFYSYGIPKVQIGVELDNSKRSITRGIKFYKLRIPGSHSFDSIRPDNSAISTRAPLFESYALDLSQKEKARSSAKKSTSNAPVSVSANALGPKAEKKVINVKIFRKLRKLRNDRKAFFADSKMMPVRMIGKLIA